MLRELTVVLVEPSPPTYSLFMPMFIPSPTDLPTKFSSFNHCYFSKGLFPATC